MATTVTGFKASETFGTTSPVTGSDPSGATDGQPLDYLEQIVVEVHATDDVALGGAGTLECWTYNDTSAKWGRASGADFTVDKTKKAQTFDAVDVFGMKGSRVKWVPVGVSFAGGGSNGIVVRQHGYAKSERLR